MKAWISSVLLVFPSWLFLAYGSSKLGSISKWRHSWWTHCSWINALSENNESFLRTIVYLINWHWSIHLDRGVINQSNKRWWRLHLHSFMNAWFHNVYIIRWFILVNNTYLHTRLVTDTKIDKQTEKTYMNISTYLPYGVRFH